MSDDPPHRITHDDVAHVARLARLTLGDAELDRYTSQLADILDHAMALSALELGDVEPLAHPLRLRNVMRDDVVGPLSDRDEVLAAAPAAEAGMFRVPPVIGDAP